MLTRRLLVLSLDAVSTEDVDILSTLPNFKSLLHIGSLIRQVESVYPTLTYPAHATIITGYSPIHHGIINNTLLEPNHLNSDWFWYHKAIQVPTLFDLAYAKGLSTCSILWPVTARGPITYNLPEIFPTKSWHHQLIMSGFAGSLTYQLDLQKRFGHIRQGTSQPALDDFVLSCMKHTLLHYKPEVMFVHMTDVDTTRHYTGHDSNESMHALVRHDRRLGEIIATLKEANLYEETTFIILGDHAQLPVHSQIRLNKILVDEGLMQVDSKGRITKYDAISKSCDGSCYIYLRDHSNKTCLEKVQTLLTHLLNDTNSSIERIFTREEVIKLGADSSCSFMVEAKKGYYFIDTTSGEFIETIDVTKVGSVPHHILSSHGYLPTKPNYTTFLLATGPGIKENHIVQQGSLLNHAPTFAHLLGLSLKNIDGHIEWSILKENEVNL